MEKQLKREEIFKGKIFHVVKDEVELDDGTTSFREVVYHNGGVCIALKDPDDNRFFMVKQYRYSLSEEMLEFCAGKLEENEDVFKAIERECEEELGYKAKNIRYFGSMVPTVGYCSEKVHLFYGEKGEKVGQHLDEDERLNVYKYSFEEIQEMIRNNSLKDSKTIILAYHIMMEGLNER